MHNLNLLQVGQRIEYLNGKGPDIRHVKRCEVVRLQQLVQTHGEQLSDDADVFLEHDEVLDAQDVLLVFDVLLLCFHQDVYFVEGQLHVLLF